MPHVILFNGRSVFISPSSVIYTHNAAWTCTLAALDSSELGFTTRDPCTHFSLPLNFICEEAINELFCKSLDTALLEFIKSFGVSFLTLTDVIPDVISKY